MTAIGDHVERLELGNAWLVDPVARREGRARILVESGRIDRVDVDWEPHGHRAQAADESAVLVIPGMVDLHSHFREPGREHAETVATGVLAAAHGGFTSVAVMPNTEPPADRAELIVAQRRSAEATRSPVRVRPYGTITEGRAGTALAPLGELADAGAVGFSDDGSPVEDAALFRHALGYAGAIGRPVVEHPEDRTLSRDSEANEGLAATILGLRGAPAAAEVAAVARDLAILEDAVREAPADAAPALHLTHLSCAESVELVRRAKQRGLPVTCDVTPHHLALHDGWIGGDRRFSWDAHGAPWAGGPSDAPPFDSSTRVNPPLRSAEDARSLARGLADGTIDAIATDHAPHGVVEKNVEFGDAAAGISGIETAVGLVLSAVEAGWLSLVDAVRALTFAPAAILDGSRDTTQPARGAFAVGALAEFVVIDRSKGWTVTETALLSRGKNSPLLGRALPGRVLMTVAGGRVAYADPDFG